MDFITGVGEQGHVTSTQHRAIFERVIGPESYILDANELLEPELQSNNSLKIRSGMLSHHGGIAEVQKNTYDEVTIANGTQDMKRIDLVVARYERNQETEVEHMKWVVIQGEPSEGTPVAPDYIHGNMQDGDVTDDCPIFEVRLDGIQVTEVKKLLTVVSGGIAELNSKLYTLNYNNKKDILTATGATFTAPYNGVIRYMNRASAAGAFFEYLIGGSGTAISNHIYGADSYLSGEFTVCEGDTITCRYISIKSSKTTFIPWV